jgi:hypothetical protein
MTDAARLVLAVDSSQAKTAATNLDAMTNSAGRAATAADRLQRQTGLARHELVNLSRQAQDIGVSLASGQSPFTVLIQQGTQVADVFANSQGSVRGFGGQVASVLTPTRLLAGGLLGVGAGFAFMLKNVADSAKQFDDMARSVNTTIGTLRGLQQAASFKGIGQEDFFKAMQQFGGQVYDAKNNMGQLADFLRANGQSAKGFQDAFEKVAELIKNARDDQERLQLLQRAGLPATMDWVRFLSQGKDGIRAATAEAVKFNESAEGKLIASARKFDEAWATATTKMVNNFKSAMVEIVGAMASVQVPKWLQNAASGAVAGAMRGQGAGPLGAVVGGVAGGIAGAVSPSTPNSIVADRFGAFSAGGNGGLQSALQNRANSLNGTKPTVDPEVLRRQMALEQQRIGILSQLGQVEDVVRAKELEIAAARQNGVAITKAQETALLAVARAQVENYRVAQQAAIGIFDMAKAQQAANDNLKALVAQGLLDPNNPKQWAAANEVARKSLEQLGDQAAIAGSKFEQLKRYQLDAANTRTAFDGFAVRSLDTFTNSLADVVTGARNVKDAVADMVRSILADLVKLAIRQAITGPIAGAIGGLFGGAGGIPKFAGGTDSAPGGWSLVGEKGPELVNLPRGARVFSNDNTRGMLSGGSVAFGDSVVNVYGNADQYALSQIRGELAANRKLLAGMLAQAKRDQRFAQTGVG